MTKVKSTDQMGNCTDPDRVVPGLLPGRQFYVFCSGMPVRVDMAVTIISKAVRFI